MQKDTTLELLQFSEQQWNRFAPEGHILHSSDFPGMKDDLLAHFQDESLNLMKILSDCLREEKRILASASPQQTMLLEIVNVLEQAEQTVAALTEVQLPEWKSRHQLSCIGSPVDTSLDHLQERFTAVAELLLEVRKQLHNHNKKYQGSDASGLLGAHEQLTQSLLTSLLANALVVEKQLLIVKTGVNFSATVRFLVNLPEFKDRLKVKAVFDKDVEEILKINGMRQFRFLSEVSKVLDVDETAGALRAEFADMEIEEIKKSRGKRKGGVVVTEELHIVKFVTELQFDGLWCNIEISSLPVVVVSSTNQIPAAWASVLWCSVLSSIEPRNLLLFVKPPPIAWQQLAQVLSWQFLSVGQRGLDENQLSLLRDRIVDDPEGLVHWEQFKNESTWIWGILDLIKTHLAGLWRDGRIMGFVSRGRTDELLREKPSGTFLLRFSESNKKGAVTFSWVEHANAEAQMHAVAPYTKDDLSKMSMQDFLNLYSLKEEGNTTRNPLLYLYPDIPRAAAFGPDCSTEKFVPKNKDGYIGRTLVPTSLFLTPPSSPQLHMEVDPDTSAEDHQRAEELFDHRLDVPGSPVWSPPAAPWTEITFYDPCLHF
ncbi:signal transducer and activator of transcription 1-alpha/beta isoform X1 [Pleuronectes platessa]|uniref:signal transducer and activator of transcription 1-alpha/beta isoform X1 n=2 Tax=Pleuronectes platessa TaxID=8262 RepID=UPI00232A6578|nr:signal transducer and activator of transcription 1-alpha/beta isoform X1 [Pleuronectes platessa]XP_053295056.1 signal transducer and activator of transcription 1-alpha/beta isoform X1 [Pleuronectes platessa]